MKKAGLRTGSTSVALLVLIVALSGCGGDGKKSIVLYNGQHPQLVSALVSAFQKESGVKVGERSNDTIVLASQILQEGSHSPADVYLSENSPELMTLEQHGLLSKLDSSILSQVPARYESPNGDWIGVALRVSSLVYNSGKIPASKLPASILDLAQPQWKGKVALAPTDSDFPPVVAAVLAREGKKATIAWLAGIKRNAETYQDEEAVVAAVNHGDVAVGVINQYYWYRLRLETGQKGMHSALYYFPHDDPGSIVNISGIGVLDSSKHKENAQKFVAFVVSEAGQKLIAKGDDFEYPTRPGVAPNQAVPPLDTIPHTPVSVASLGTDQKTTKLIEQAGLAAG
jgi:iron(III) transport system substrate-binding protein